MEFINNNGLLQIRNLPIFQADERIVRYGDGLFETIRMFEGQLPFFEMHVDRLLDGLEKLGFAIPEFYSIPFFLLEIRKLVGFSANARIRLQVYRSTDGFYLPDTDEPAFLMISDPLETGQFQLNEQGWKLGIVPDIQLPTDYLANLKTSNALPYILAAKCAQTQQLDDVLLLNDKGRIAEASSSNIFIYRDGQLHTPALTEGCIAGVMRRNIIRLAQQLGIPVNESQLAEPAIESAEEVFLTNSIQGIRWVKQFKNATFVSTLANELTAILNQSIYE